MPLVQKSWTAILVSLRKIYSLVSVAGVPLVLEKFLLHLNKGIYILAWRIPWTEEPGEVQTMESQRGGHD